MKRAIRDSLDGKAILNYPYPSLFFTGLFGAAGATLAGLIAYNSAVFHEMHDNLEDEQGYLSNLNFLGMNDPVVAVLIVAGSLMLMASAYHQYCGKPTFATRNRLIPTYPAEKPPEHITKAYNFHTAAMVCIGLLAAYGLSVGFAALAGHRPDDLSDIGFNYDNNNDLSDSDQNKLGAYFTVFTILAIGVVVAGWNRIVPAAKNVFYNSGSSQNRRIAAPRTDDGLSDPMPEGSYQAVPTMAGRNQ